jgi:sensor histidine kinase YesM
MNRFSIIAALVALAIFVTFLMFLTTLITAVLGSAAIYFVWIICIPVEIISLFGGLIVVLIIVGNTLHSLKLRRIDEEHYYQVVREQRELDLQKRKIQQHLYRLRTSRNIHPPHRPTLRH